MLKSIRTYCKTAGVGLLLLCAALSALSVVTLFSVGAHGGLELGGFFGNCRPAFTQLFAAVLGIASAVVVSLVDYRRLAELWPVHAVCWGLVLLTFVPGVGYEPAGTGSQSWIAMPFGMSFQPTEIAKVSFTLSFAAHLARVRDGLNRPRAMAGVLCHMALPVLLIHWQGDDGTAMVFLAMGAIMLVAAGLNRWVVAGLAAVCLAAAPLLWHFVLGNYQRERILGLFNPQPYADTIMYQQLQARQAIAEGGLLGKGLFQPEHVYVPRSENDFVFSYFAECCGFLGSLVLLGLLLAAMLVILRTAAKSLDWMGAMVCTGVFAALFVQSLVNLGMNLMLFPVMGVTLPFVSAGGTSVWTLYLSVGLVMGVTRIQNTAIRCRTMREPRDI